MTTPTQNVPSTVEEPEQTFCYGHPDTPTRLRCSRCDRPICGRCAIPASVGQHCPECVAEAKRSAPKVRSAIRANAPIVTGIIGVTVAMYVVQTVATPVLEAFAMRPPRIAAGDWWRLLTPMLLHAPLFQGPMALLHIFFNMYVLSAYGPNLEQAFGPVRFVLVYLISGFVASSASYAFNTCDAFGVGASGAIFGVVGALLAYLYNRRSSTFMAQYLRGIMGFVVLNLLIGLSFQYVDNYAHIGGLVAGGLLGFGFDHGRTDRLTPRHWMTAVAVAALGVALVVWRTSTFGCVF